MTEATLHNLRLVGTTSSSGGRFRNVRITGEAVMAGNIECQRLTCVGTVDIAGSLRADAVKLTGECKVEGNMTASRISGTGQIDVDGDVRGEAIKLMGDIRVAGNCEVETLTAGGGLHVGGLVNAERVDLRLYGPCQAREIGGGSVIVKRSRAARLKQMFQSRIAADLTADLIEGDILDLEHTKAQVVRGNRVMLGPGCEIGRAEYRDELQVDRNAVIRERVPL